MKHKQITEKMLLDHYTGLTNGCDNISVVGDDRIIWCYRHNDRGDGYKPVVNSREDADYIDLCYDRAGQIALDDRCKDHPALSRIADHVRVISGDLIC